MGSQLRNMEMSPNIKIFLPCLLLHAILVGRTNGFGHQPKGGWGPLWLNDTNPGEIDMLGDLPVHRYGPASNAKWVLWGHDIFGVLSGRTMEYCAKMNEDLGMVLGDLHSSRLLPWGRPLDSWGSCAFNLGS